MMATVTVRNLTKTYPNKKGAPILANDSLSFEVNRGEMFGLLGPNGAGKTTLVMQLLGLIRPTSGEICVEDVDVVRTPERVKPLVGFLPQSGLPMRFISVERALRYTGRLRGQNEAAARQQAVELMSELGLTKDAHRDVNTLSGGATRLVNLAMALMGEPRLLVLDEPTNELDPRNRRVIWEMLDQLNTMRGVTCILVTHNVHEADRVVHRVGVMHGGHLVAIGTPGEIKSQLGGAVRLEFRLKDPEEWIAPDSFPELGTIESVHPGEYRLYMRPDSVGRGVDTVLNGIGMDHFDDFRIAPPSLEDAYLALEGGASCAPNF